eukprot:2059159-Prymnesium_polylepis.1
MRAPEGGLELDERELRQLRQVAAAQPAPLVVVVVVVIQQPAARGATTHTPWDGRLDQSDTSRWVGSILGLGRVSRARCGGRVPSLRGVAA